MNSMLLRKSYLFKPSSNVLRCLSNNSPSAKVEKSSSKKAKNFGEKKFEQSSSFAFNSFLGKVVPDSIFPFPCGVNEDQLETINLLVDPTTKFFEQVNNAAESDEKSKFSKEIIDGLKNLGAFGMQVPEEYEGVGLNHTQYARMVEIVGANDMAIGTMLGAHQAIGYKAILLFGNDEQKKKYLPDLATGRKIASYALTEPASGSDASSIKTRAVLDASGKFWVLNGSKIWITNGGYSDVLTVFAQTPVRDAETGEEKDKITAFIVERAFGGLTSGPAENKMGIKASNTTEVYFDNVKIPTENVIGKVGDGFKIAMSVLNNGRFGMAAATSGTMTAAIKQAIEHCNQRKQFGSLISEYGSIQEKLSRMVMLQYVTQSMGYHIAGMMDNGYTDYHVEAAMSKVFGSEAAWYVVDEAIQILGGMGFMKDPGLERVLRDLRIFRIFEGENNILRLFTALSGLQYAGSGLKQLQRAMNDPKNNLPLFLGQVSIRALRSIGLAGSGTASNLPSLVHPSLIGSAVQSAQCIDYFGSSVEKLLAKHGKAIINEQYHLRRIADAAINIYGQTCALSRATQSLNLNDTSEAAQHERKIVQSFCTISSAQAMAYLDEINSLKFNESFDDMKHISKSLCSNGGVFARHPLGLWE